MCVSVCVCANDNAPVFSVWCYVISQKAYGDDTRRLSAQRTMWHQTYCLQFATYLHTSDVTTTTVSLLPLQAKIP